MQRISPSSPHNKHNLVFGKVYVELTLNKPSTSGCGLQCHRDRESRDLYCRKHHSQKGSAEVLQGPNKNLEMFPFNPSLTSQYFPSNVPASR